MELELLQVVLRIIEVGCQPITAFSLLCLAICAVIYIVRTNPERTARQFREVFKIKGSACLIVGLLFLAAAAPASADPFYKHKRWWAGVAVIGAAVALDAHSSCRAFSHGAIETNPWIYGTRSCAEVSGLMVGAFGFYTTMHALEWHVTQNQPNKAIRIFGQVALPAVAVGIHVPAAIHNYDLDLRPAPVRIPPPCERREFHDCD